MVSNYDSNWQPKDSDGQLIWQQIIEQIRSGVDLKEILQTTVSTIQKILTVDRVLIYRFTSNGMGELTAQSFAESCTISQTKKLLPTHYLSAIRRLFLQQDRQRIIVDVQTGKTTRVLSSWWTEEDTLPEILPINSIGEDYLLVWRQLGISHCLFIPIIEQENLWGFLLCEQCNYQRFYHRQLQTVQLLIDQLAIAISQSNLLKHHQVINQREALIGRLNALVNNNSSNPAIASLLLTEIVQAMAADGGRLYVLIDLLGKQQKIYTSGTSLPDKIPLEKNPLWHQLMYGHDEGNGLKYRQNDSLIYPIVDINNDPKLQSLLPIFDRLQIRSLLIIPLRYQQQCVGCLTLWRRNSLTFNPQQINSGDSQGTWTESQLNLAQRFTLYLYMYFMQKRVESMFRHQSYYDGLTGLPNRQLFQQKLNLALVNIQTTGNLLAVVFLDLDYFKNINDSLGHRSGDRLLKLVADRLKESLNLGDVVARWSGDEFTILITGLADIHLINERLQLILNQIQKPFIFPQHFAQLNSNALYVKASMGVAIAPNDGLDDQTLLKHANAALNRAKQEGRNNYQIYQSVISNKAMQRIKLEHTLYWAIENNKLSLHFQPQINIKTGKIVGLESLIRCADAQDKFISPAEFIPIAEENGLIHQLGEWVLFTACKQNKLWQEQGLGYLPIAVNLSAQQLQQQNFVNLVQSVLIETGLKPEYLELEVTETIAIKDLDFTVNLLHQLRNIGIKISLDDFGTGYSSLSALKYLPLDQLKVDRSFIQELTQGSIDAGIVKTIVNLGHDLQLTVIAEGVENQAQLDFLTSIGCDAVQGYFFSPPLPAQKLAQFIRSNQLF